MAPPVVGVRVGGAPAAPVPALSGGGAAGSRIRTRAPPISQVRISRLPPYPEMRSWTIPSPSDASPRRAAPGFPRCRARGAAPVVPAGPGRALQSAPNPGPSSSTWMTTQPWSDSTRTSTRPSATRQALSRTLRTARHSATGSMCAHASPPVKQTACGVASRIPVTISAESSSTRIRSGLGGGRSAFSSSAPSSSRRSRWSSHRVSPRSCSMRALLVAPTSSATTTAEASMMIVPSSWRMSCRSRRRHSTCAAPLFDSPLFDPPFVDPPLFDPPLFDPSLVDSPAAGSSSPGPGSRGPVPASVCTPAGGPAGEDRDHPLSMGPPVRYSSTASNVLPGIRVLSRKWP